MMINERIVIYVEDGYLVAQCLEHDICVQALNMDDLFARLAIAFWAERENMANIGPAPQYILNKWSLPDQALVSENERLRALAMRAYAEAWEDSKGWRTHDMCWDISNTRAALQPKEGEG